MTDKVRGEAYRTTLVCVDAYEKGIPRGRFYNPSMPAAKPFHGVTHFLHEMEKVLEQTEQPKAFAERRTFAPGQTLPEDTGELPTLTGTEATFALRVLFRQNASWQGSVTWLEGRQEQSFRSVLELILLLDSAMRCPKAS